jgi:gramicidin S synthase 2
MVPSYFVELDKLPLNSNGKINRGVLPLPEISAGEGYVAPSNRIEEKLVAVWSEVLNISPEKIGTTANFFQIGGHSLKASILTGRVLKEIGVEFPLRDVFLYPTIQTQASQIEFRGKKMFLPIQNLEERDYYPLSPAQKRMYLLQQMDLGSTVYNMPFSIPLCTDVEKAKIKRVFNQLISRHGSFRTSFEIREKELFKRYINKYRL